jgi:hypothetical protein
MTAALAEQKTLFTRVEGIPAGSDIDTARTHNRPGQSAPNPGDAIRWMLDYAGHSGADYLLVYGGTIDTIATPGALSILDLTILGAYVIPGHEVKASCRAAGALIHVPTGRVVANVSAGNDQACLTTLVSEGGDRLQLMADLRDRVIRDLAKDVIRSCNADLAYVPTPNRSR